MDSRNATAQRNKGVICANFFNTGKCSLVNCPYLHSARGETLPLPATICRFFLTAKCLKDNCKFFHGSSEDYQALREANSKMYKPEDVLPIRDPLDVSAGSEKVPMPVSWPPPVPRPPVMMQYPGSHITDVLSSPPELPPPPRMMQYPTPQYIMAPQQSPQIILVPGPTHPQNIFLIPTNPGTGI